MAALAAAATTDNNPIQNTSFCTMIMWFCWILWLRRPAINYIYALFIIVIIDLWMLHGDEASRAEYNTKESIRFGFVYLFFSFPNVIYAYSILNLKIKLSKGKFSISFVWIWIREDIFRHSSSCLFMWATSCGSEELLQTGTPTLLSVHMLAMHARFHVFA